MRRDAGPDACPDAYLEAHADARANAQQRDTINALPSTRQPVRISAGTGARYRNAAVIHIATRYCAKPTDPKEPPMNDPQCTQFLADIRKPLLALHKAILDHERAAYEKEFGPVTPAAFLQVLINGSGFRWLTPLSTVIASVDEILDDDEADAGDRLAIAEAVVGLFSPDQPNNTFLPRYLPLLQADPAILHHHGEVAQLLRGVQAK